MFDEERTFTFPPNAETRNYMLYFGHRHARDCMNNTKNINVTKDLKS